MQVSWTKGKEVFPKREPSISDGPKECISGNMLEQNAAKSKKDLDRRRFKENCHSKVSEQMAYYKMADGSFDSARFCLDAKMRTIYKARNGIPGTFLMRMVMKHFKIKGTNGSAAMMFEKCFPGKVDWITVKAAEDELQWKERARGRRLSKRRNKNKTRSPKRKAIDLVPRLTSTSSPKGGMGLLVAALQYQGTDAHECEKGENQKLTTSLCLLSDTCVDHLTSSSTAKRRRFEENLSNMRIAVPSAETLPRADDSVASSEAANLTPSICDRQSPPLLKTKRVLDARTQSSTQSMSRMLPLEILTHVVAGTGKCARPEGMGKSPRNV